VSFQAVLKLDLEEWQHSIREKERALAELEVLQAQARFFHQLTELLVEYLLICAFDFSERFWLVPLGFRWIVNRWCWSD
jgi:hypothetical protein